MNAKLDTMKLTEPYNPRRKTQSSYALAKEKHLIAFEIGEDMEESMTNLTEKYYPNDEFCFQKDLYGKTRFLFIKHR